jgi:hypothetical protein
VATEHQLDIARRLGLDVRDETETVAAARILDAVAVAAGQRPPSPATPRQVELAQHVGLDVSADTTRVAFARLADGIKTRDLDAAKRLDLRPGDPVVIETKVEHGVFAEMLTVSSVRNGRVWFKGGPPGKSTGAGQLRRPTADEVAVGSRTGSSIVADHRIGNAEPAR